MQESKQEATKFVSLVTNSGKSTKYIVHKVNGFLPREIILPLKSSSFLEGIPVTGKANSFLFVCYPFKKGGRYFQF